MKLSGEPRLDAIIMQVFINQNLQPERNLINSDYRSQLKSTAIMVKTRQWLLAKKPTDLPQLEGQDQTFKLEETDLPDPKDDEVLVKLVYLSNDPAQRGWINKGVDPERL